VEAFLYPLFVLFALPSRMKPSRPYEDLLTLSEAAKQKKVSRQAVYDAIKSGRLTCLRVLGRPVVRQADLKSWQIIGRRQSSPLSAEHKARISRALKRRWAKRKS
jgi:excisionase family DNA binding protein